MDRNSLVFQQVYLPFEASAVSPQAVAARDDPVARDQEGNRIAVKGLSGRAKAPRRPRLMGHPAIGTVLAPGNLAGRGQDPLLKRREEKKVEITELEGFTLQAKPGLALDHLGNFSGRASPKAFGKRGQDFMESPQGQGLGFYGAKPAPKAPCRSKPPRPIRSRREKSRIGCPVKG